MPDVVQELGAAAGLATVVGLAVLSALHVSQARDLKRLREWAGRAPERADPGAAAVAVSRPRRRSQPSYRRTATRHVAAALVGLLLVLGGAATYGVVHLTGEDGGDTSGKAQANDDNGMPEKPKRSRAAVEPGTVTVAVLNGTTVPHLAATLRDRIAAAGFKKGMINDFSGQQLAESIVQYAPGRQADANAVSRTLGIGRREPITADSRALAGDATVIVIVGTDQAP